MSSLRIVVDSTADLPPEVAAALDITVVPCLLRFGNQSFREGVDISRAEFFARLRTDPYLPATAAPAPGVFENSYRQLASQTDTIVSIHLSAQYSGIFNAARLGAQAAADRVRVVPVDSSQISLGMGLMAMAAAEAARDGASLQEVLSLLDDLKQRTHLFAIPETLDNLYRSGRINQLVARLGTLLRIKPILHVYQGEVTLQERVRSWGRAEQRLVETVRSMAPLERVVLAHIQRPEAAEKLGRALSDVLPPQTFTAEVGVTMSTHVGLGAAGIALIRA
jgi:DegV family protein with EDD domain